MPAMRVYRVKVSKAVSSDLDELSLYIASLYRPESGHKYVNRILGQLASLSYTADAYQYSRFQLAKQIHPNAKSISIMNHRWTAVFHIEGDSVIVDRIMPSSRMY
jgi:plasmid stabilization system protein ParE